MSTLERCLRPRIVDLFAVLEKRLLPVGLLFLVITGLIDAPANIRHQLIVGDPARGVLVEELLIAGGLIRLAPGIETARLGIPRDLGLSSEIRKDLTIIGGLAPARGAQLIAN